MSLSKPINGDTWVNDIKRPAKNDDFVSLLGFMMGNLI